MTGSQHQRSDRRSERSRGREQAALRRVTASKDHPRYLVKSEQSDGEAVQKPDALKQT